MVKGAKGNGKDMSRPRNSENTNPPTNGKGKLASHKNLRKGSPLAFQQGLSAEVADPDVVRLSLS